MTTAAERRGSASAFEPPPTSPVAASVCYIRPHHIRSDAPGEHTFEQLKPMRSSQDLVELIAKSSIRHGDVTSRDAYVRLGFGDRLVWFYKDGRCVGAHPVGTLTKWHDVLRFASTKGCTGKALLRDLPIDDSYASMPVFSFMEGESTADLTFES